MVGLVKHFFPSSTYNEEGHVMNFFVRGRAGMGVVGERFYV